MLAELANESLCSHHPSRPNKLDNRAEAVAPPPVPLLENKHAQLTRDPYLRCTNAKLLADVGVFLDDFLGLAQGPQHRRYHVRRTLSHALDKVFWSLNRQDAKKCNEVLSLKKLDTGDCSWSTFQTLLGWIVYSINMTINLLIPST